MTTEQAKRAINEFSDSGTLFWMFTGGEPLLRDDIGELIDQVNNYGMVSGLVTNGTLVKEKLSEIRKLDYIVLSLDGPKEDNDKLRGRGSFEKIFEGLKIAKKNNIDTIINTVISRANTSNNFKGIKFILDLSEKLGCKVSFSSLYTDPFNKEISAEQISEENMASLIKLLQGRNSFLIQR